MSAALDVVLDLAVDDGVGPLVEGDLVLAGAPVDEVGQAVVPVLDAVVVPAAEDDVTLAIVGFGRDLVVPRPGADHALTCVAVDHVASGAGGMKPALPG